MALGSGSITVAITSIASSLLTQLLEVLDSEIPRFFCRLLGQHQRPVSRHGHGMFEVGAVAAVFGDRGPLIVEHPRSRLAYVDHRFDSQHHAFSQPNAVAANAKVGDLRVLMHARPDPVAHKLAYHAETIGLHILLHRGA